MQTPTPKVAAVEIEAEYLLERPVQCPVCSEEVEALHVVRLLRGKVNFTSTLPRRGYVTVCPLCRTLVPAQLGGGLV